jgi:hypothetical protein
VIGNGVESCWDWVNLGVHCLMFDV